MICNTFKDILESICEANAFVMSNVLQFPYFSHDRVSKDKKHHVELHYLRVQKYCDSVFAHEIKINKVADVNFAMYFKCITGFV